MKRTNNKFRNNNYNNQIYSLNYKFDSNSIAGKVSGTALDLIKRYNELAKEAHTNNDYVSAEVFRQYAEHYRKIVTEINEKTRIIPPELMESPEIRKAVEQIEESAFSDAQLEGYDKFWDGVRVEKTLISDALKKGHAEGRAEGRIEGERIKQLEIARNLKKLGLNTEAICQATGLSPQEVEGL